MIFPRLCKIFRAKELAVSALILYAFGGCAAGLFSNIYVILMFRAVVGIGVGIIMPMSTGLISFYYTRDKQDRLMGYSSAMNQMGGVISTSFRHTRCYELAAQFPRISYGTFQHSTVHSISAQ